jgi:hypothetical protein
MYFTVTVDTEEEWDWAAGWPTDAPRVTNVLRLPRFQELCDRRGVRPTYFVNLAVLDDEPARNVVLELSRRANVEIGMHIHPWNTPPLEGSGPVRARETFLHNLPDELIEAKLSSVLARFAEFSLHPTSFRGGRYSSGGRITQFLHDRQFRVDASVLPLTTWPDDGAPDYRHRGLHPVRLPPRREGGLPLWEVPLTLAFTRRPLVFWRRAYELVENSWLGRLRLIGIAERSGLVRKVWLNFESPMGERMWALFPMARTLQLPCISFTVHSSSLVAGEGPYTRSAADEDRVFRQIAEVFARLADAADLRPSTMTELAQHLEAAHHACIGN